MAANMMEILKRIQCDLADQKNYMRNLHVISKNLSEKMNFMEEKVCDLPQVLVTMGRLEQQVKKNNMLLFGNEETENPFEDLVPYKTDPDDNNTEHLVEDTEKTQLSNLCKVSRMEETEYNNKETNKRDNFQRTHKYKDEVGELITNEIREIKNMINDFIQIRHTSNELAATCKQHVAAGISPTNLDIDQVSKLNDKLNNMTKVYENDMREMKELINDSIATTKKLNEETLKTLLKQDAVEPSISFSAEQISQFSDELKHLTDITQSKTSEIKDLIMDSIAASKMSIQEATELRKQETAQREANPSAMREIKEFVKDLVKKTPVEEAASTVRKQINIEISPTYFSAHQLSKLNSDLKQIGEKYQETNIFPIVEVIPGVAEGHPIMKHLCEGVYFKNIFSMRYDYKLKFGVDGFKRSDVIDLITDHPILSINEVIREWLIATKVWNVWLKKYRCKAHQKCGIEYSEIKQLW